MKESSAWLSTLPSKYIGTLSDNNVVRVSIVLRLDCIFCTAIIPAILEPPGLSRDDGKMLDEMSLTPWKNLQNLVLETHAETLWLHHIVNYPFAQQSYFGTSSLYSLPWNHWVLGVPKPKNLINFIDRRIRVAAGEPKSTVYLAQSRAGNKNQYTTS